MRLIDADALKTKLDAWVVVIKHPQYYKRDEALYIIDNAPSVDAVPVVYGRWIQKKTALGKTYSVCSSCNTDFKFQTDKGTLARLDMDGLNFCPNCSAKMSKEES